MVPERLDPVLGKLIWNKNLGAYKIDDLMHLNLFGKSFVIQCWIEVDEDEMPFDDAFVEQRKALLDILEHQEELARDLEHKVLVYVNKKLVPSISIGEYDPVSDVYVPFSSLSSLGRIVKSVILDVPVIIDESLPICFLFDIDRYDAGIGVGIEGYKVKEVSTQSSFI